MSVFRFSGKARLENCKEERSDSISISISIFHYFTVLRCIHFRISHVFSGNDVIEFSTRKRNSPKRNMHVVNLKKKIFAFPFLFLSTFVTLFSSFVPGHPVPRTNIKALTFFRLIDVRNPLFPLFAPLL